MGALLDHRPGVVTKGFRTLVHEQEQEESWQLDQPEEDEHFCASFMGSPGVSSAPEDTPRSVSTPVCCSAFRDARDELREEICRTAEAIHLKDGHVANTLLSSSGPSPSPSPLPSSSEMNGHVDLRELQALQAAAVDRVPGEGALS